MITNTFCLMFTLDQKENAINQDCNGKKKANDIKSLRKKIEDLNFICQDTKLEKNKWLVGGHRTLVNICKLKI